MAEYINREHLLTEYCSEDERTWDNGLWYIEHEPTANVVEREKIDKAIEEMKALADPENTILGFDEKMGIKTAMNILVRNIGESKNEKTCIHRD